MVDGVERATHHPDAALVAGWRHDGSGKGAQLWSRPPPNAIRMPTPPSGSQGQTTHDPVVHTAPGLVLLRGDHQQHRHGGHSTGPGGQRSGRRSPYVAVAGDDVLGRGHLGQPHRPAGVQLLRADADLGAEPELAAVGEPRRRVDEDGGRVDLGGEPPRGGQVARSRSPRCGRLDQRVTWSIAASRSGTTRGGDVEGEVLGAPVVVGGRDHPVVRRERRRRRGWSRRLPAARRRPGARRSSATSAWTSSDSAALQTLVRCVLLLTTMSRAWSRSAARST